MIVSLIASAFSFDLALPFGVMGHARHLGVRVCEENPSPAAGPSQSDAGRRAQRRGGSGERVDREVATRAVAVAVERATAYAQAIGRASVTPVEIADVGLLDDGARPEAAPRMFARAMAMDAGAAPAVEFRPDDIRVTAAVEARFRAS